MGSEMLSTMLGGGIAAFLTGVFAWLAAKATAKSQVDAKKIEATGPQWDAFSQKIMDRMDVQQAEIDGLKSEVKSLRAGLESMREKYWSAILALRRVFDRHPTAVQDASLTQDVHKDVFGTDQPR